MMAAVVTKGTAKAAGLPSGTRGKTGTAEYGTAGRTEDRTPGSSASGATWPSR